MDAERAMRVLVVATILATIAAVVARPARAGVGWLVPSFFQTASEADDTPVDTVFPHPSDAEQAIIRIETVGGLLPPSALVQELPSFVLYGDGLVIFRGPSPLIDPPPALPNLRQLRVNEAGIQAILEAAATARLIGEDRSIRHELIFDAGTTIFTIAAGDQVTTTAVYALGLEVGANLPAEQRVAMETIDAFYQLLFDLPSWLPDGSIVEAEAPFAIERLQVVTQPAAEAGIEAVGVASWPLPAPLASFGRPFSGVLSPFQGMFSFEAARCGVVAGEDAATLAAVLAGASSRMLWESDGAQFALYPRPLLPDELGCPPLRDGGATPGA